MEAGGLDLTIFLLYGVSVDEGKANRFLGSNGPSSSTVFEPMYLPLPLPILTSCTYSVVGEVVVMKGVVVVV